MDVYGNISYSYGEINRDSSVFFSDKSFSIAQKLKLQLY